MPKGMRTNSPIGDPDPLEMPETKVTPQKKSDWEKIKKDTAYPEIDSYLEQRKLYFSRYLPGGTPVEDLPADERAAYWQAATVIIKEIETIQSTIDLQTKKK